MGIRSEIADMMDRELRTNAGWEAMLSGTSESPIPPNKVLPMLVSICKVQQSAIFKLADEMDKLSAGSEGVN